MFFINHPKLLWLVGRIPYIINIIELIESGRAGVKLPALNNNQDFQMYKEVVDEKIRYRQPLGVNSPSANQS